MPRESRTGVGKVYRADESLVREMRYAIEIRLGNRLDPVENFSKSLSVLHGTGGDEIEGQLPDMSEGEWKQLRGTRLTLRLEDDGILSFVLEAAKRGLIDETRSYFIDEQGRRV